MLNTCTERAHDATYVAETLTGLQKLTKAALKSVDEEMFGDSDASVDEADDVKRYCL